MKTLEKLLQEYKIRFKETEEIDGENYPFETHYITKGLTPEIKWIGGNAGYMMFNKNGVVYYKDTWATAKITEKPEKWVVKKYEQHPVWERFKEWLIKKGQFNCIGASVFKYYSEERGDNDLLSFTDHQYLTLDQWAELFLDEPKEGDWCLFWDKDAPDFKKDKFVPVPFVVAPFVRKSEILFVDIHNEYWHNCKKLSPELSAMLVKDINQIKGKE